MSEGLTDDTRRTPPPTVVCDLDGVVYVGDEPVPGAREALETLRSAGARLVLATNNAWRPPAAVAERIRAVTGFEATPEEVVTSAQAAARLLAQARPPTLVVGGAGIVSALDEVGVPMTDDPGVAEAVVAGIDLDLSYERLRLAATAIRGGARFVATNHDPTYPTPHGPWPGAGAIVAALEVASGRSPEFAGKPHQPMRHLIAERVGTGDVWVVGDRIDTDLAMATAEGWTGVLVLTGVTGSPPDRDPPRHVLDSIRELPGLVLSGPR
jgi:glycerol-1-phosphatase